MQATELERCTVRSYYCFWNAKTVGWGGTDVVSLCLALSKSTSVSMVLPSNTAGLLVLFSSTSSTFKVRYWLAVCLPVFLVPFCNSTILLLVSFTVLLCLIHFNSTSRFLVLLCSTKHGSGTVFKYCGLLLLDGFSKVVDVNSLRCDWGFWIYNIQFKMVDNFHSIAME